MAYGDPNQIIQASQQVLSKFRDFAPEGMLLFSCMTRRLFLKEATSQILSEYFKIAPAPGGYVSGEIIRIGVITHKDYRPTALGQMYLDILHRVVGDMQSE